VSTPGAAYLHRHPRLRLAGVLGAPLIWLVVVYLGSLAALLLTSLWTQDSFTAEVVRIWTLDNFTSVLTEPLYREVLLRTVLVATAVTLIDLALALPIAFYMAKVARPRVAKLLVVACLMPLWASYLIKAYAWRLLVIKDGVFEHTFGGSPGLGLVAVIMTLSYLWLPFMILPVYAGLDRVPNSLLEASADLGAPAGRTFRSVVLPLIFPALVAGSIFTFSLSLGDYITVKIVGGHTQLFGNVIYDNIGVAANLPFAAAAAVVPVAVILLYLTLVRRTGALENL
jgi:putative spermidine/putrescine transport system permease protein